MEIKMNPTKIAIIGAGNIGTLIARGLVESGQFQAGNITLTRRRTQLLEEMKTQGFVISSDNCAAVRDAEVILISVEPQQLNKVLQEISPALATGKHLLISVVTGARIEQIQKIVAKDIAIVRAMPNTAIAVRESMTTMATNSSDDAVIRLAQSIFDTVGKTLIIREEEMNAATALGACGIAFFLRAIRAASQGGIEIGFHSHEALAIAAQTAKGAASLLLTRRNHPEQEIDRVTTPQGCTIAGLNQMEHEGFSSALIKGIVVSATKAAKLYSGNQD
jgi:pyrroline-5-carboxylate reductase